MKDILSPNSNKEVHSGIEFEIWANAKGLLGEERYLIEKYLKPDLKTVEAGTNGGRIVFQMKNMGYSDLYGFDYIPELIDVAIARDVDRQINFAVGDAIELTYADSYFDQIIYLQQIVCLIENAADRLKALQESYRILKSGGTGLFSVLCFETRSSGSIYSAYLTYLKTIRKLRGDDRNIQYLPWLKLGGKLNPKAISDRSPYVYWYRVEEICQLLRSVGFEIVSMGSDLQVQQNSLKTDARELLAEDLSGMLYIVVKK